MPFDADAFAHFPSKGWVTLFTDCAAKYVNSPSAFAIAFTSSLVTGQIAFGASAIVVEEFSAIVSDVCESISSAARVVGMDFWPDGTVNAGNFWADVIKGVAIGRLEGAKKGMGLVTRH